MTLTQKSWRKPLWTSLAILLALPLVAMAFTSEVAWGPGDFVVFAGLLGLLGLGVEVVAYAVKEQPTRAIGIAAVILGVLWLWAELAVGVFTTWGS